MKEYGKTELIIALVGRAGTDLEMVEGELRRLLQKRFGYRVKQIALSQLLHKLKLKTVLETSPEYNRIDSHMTAGNEVRQEAHRNDFLALMAMSDIHYERKGKPNLRKAYILRSLKHPDEVHLLRTVYGSGFWLIGIHANRHQCLQHLCERCNMTEEEAEYLIERDYLEPDIESGQQTSKTFHRADVFIRQDDIQELQRFLDLLFGCPSETPRQDEQAMFIAHAAAIRSGDLSRQVGAAIVNAHGDLIAVGTNEVPDIQGGLFWPDRDNKEDLRDLAKPRNPSNEYKDLLIQSVVNRLTKKYEKGKGRPALDGSLQKLIKSKKEEVIQLLKDSELQDLTEFQRAVHAEMEALLACARSESTPRGGTLYTTLFPCHICAKHIVAAGIRRIVYIEPYPKSRTMQLLDDFITLDPQSKENQGKIRAEPFVGIGPRRYVDLFSIVWGTGIPLRRKNREGVPIKWTPNMAQIRLPMLPTSYMDREAEAVKEVAKI